MSGRAVLRRRLAVVAEVLVVGVLGAVLGLLVAGRLTTGVGPFETRMSLTPSFSGETEVSLPPLGALQLDTHVGPLRLAVEVVRLREDAAREIVRNPDRLTGLGEEVRRDLTRGLVRLALQAGAVTVLGATALGLLVFRRSRRTLFAGLTGVGTLLLSAGLVYGTFDEESLAQPRYTGLLSVAPSAIGDVRDILDDFGTYTRSLGALVTNVTELYAVTSSLQTYEPQEEGISVLHISDLHLSPIGLEVALSVAEQFGVDAVIDTGDLTDYGSDAESRYVSGVSRFTVPYVFIKGNHDSAATVAAVRAAGGTVLDDPGQVVEVAGLRLVGVGDPRFTPDKATAPVDEQPDAVVAQGAALRDAVLDGDLDPDVVLVHDPVAAGPLRGHVPLVLAGHTHRRDATTVDGTLLLTQGSTGGAGLRGLEGEEPRPLGLSVMYFAGEGDELRLRAYDALTLGGLGTSSAQIERRLVPDSTPVPAGSPVPSPTPPTTPPTTPSGDRSATPSAAPPATRSPVPAR